MQKVKKSETGPQILILSRNNLRNFEKNYEPINPPLKRVDGLSHKPSTRVYFFT